VGDWNQVDVTSQGSTFQYCTFEYGGSGNSAVLAISAGSNSVTFCTFSNNSYDIGYTASQDGTNISNNTYLSAGGNQISSIAKSK
jgi:hypothetical protein